MTLDLASRADILALTAKFDAILAHLTAPKPPADEPLLSVQQVSAYTRYDRKTVEKWVKEGRYDLTGKRVYLSAYEYSGRLRFKRADVEAFGLGVGVLVPSLAAGQRPEPTKPDPAAPKPKKKRSAVDSKDALKVA